MLKIANYFESSLGRNDGNPLYVTAFLKRMQHYCNVANGRPADPQVEGYFPLVRGKRSADPLARELAAEFLKKDLDGVSVAHLRPYGDLKAYGTFDVHLWVDWGEDALTGVLPYVPIECPKPMAYWASDTHLGYEHRLAMAKKADWVFVAQKRAQEEFKRDGVESVWLPHAVEPLAYPHFSFASKTYDVSFVGHINSQNRIDALDRLFREFPNFYYGQKRFEQAAEIFGRSKIVFNISMRDDINMRTFEGMATGSLMLTSWIPTIEELFEDGKHLVLYRSEEEMVDKARYYITHDAEREKIAAAGYEHVMANHTFKNRVKAILDTVTAKRPAAV